ncbi:hypothetical protein RND71_043878 [Anisodus tanguticus]|uniref:type II protein arginine methyltransferase n=1 Tax=Anisodus tanguticus TaxID=243964 RepID=A0AAE1URP5_9SOLA|nr:hypothetical protein RND71_043878 [Anisodus tanguticus]
MREIKLEVPNVRWDDIGGMENVKSKLIESLIWPIKFKDTYDKFNEQQPKGVLMFGPPGCSKTMIGKALATECKHRFISIKGPEIFSKYVGDSEKTVREIFNKARQVSPSIIFFDEIDAIAVNRSSDVKSASSVNDKVVSTLLNELDGIEKLSNVFIVATTNRPDIIDKSLLRTGRLDSLIYVPLPNFETHSVPESTGFTTYIAHEFLDALPIHKFKKNDSGNWREILVDYEKNSNKEEVLRYILSNNETPASKAYIPPGIKENDFEVCPEAAVLIDKLVKRINNNSGLFLGVDYGYSEKLSIMNRDTFRGFREHALWHPLVKPGTADLTADVDFDFLKKIASHNSTFFGPVTQKNFLNSLGVQLRLSKLLKNEKDEKEAQKLKSGVNMITEEMGQRFKFISIFPKESKHLFRNDPPAGFYENDQ